MISLNTRELRERGAAAEAPFRRETAALVLVYCGVIAALSLGSNGLNLLLESKIGQTGGLGGLGMRSVLQTIQMILNYVNLLFGPFWSAGFLLAMVRMIQGEAPRLEDLTGGFRRFMRILSGVFFEVLTGLAVMIAAVNVGSVLFTMSPMGIRFQQLIEPALANPELITPEGTVNMELLPAEALSMAAVPMLVITLLVFLPLYIWISYGFRLSTYLILERPIGGIRAHMESIRLMRGHKRQLLKLDLQFWWYHALGALIGCVCYLDLILALLGIRAPVGETAMLFGTISAYCILLTGLYLWKKCQVDAAYALAYRQIVHATME